jgi:hypothetical protein
MTMVCDKRKEGPNGDSGVDVTFPLAQQIGRQKGLADSTLRVGYDGSEEKSKSNQKELFAVQQRVSVSRWEKPHRPPTPIST